jgi:excisionase family DNA binding protein
MLVDDVVAEDELLTVAEVAAKLKTTPATVLRWIRERRLPATKPGGDRMGYRIRPAELEAFIDEHRV